MEQYRGREDVIVLALPRGGVPVGYEVARALGLPLDIFVVRKLGVPGREELAMGAIASGGVVVLNQEVVRGLNISSDVLRQTAQQEYEELQRRQTEYRGDRPEIDVAGKTPILVDDGLATGSSMRAAIRSLRKLNPAKIVVAVPSAPSATCNALRAEVDDVICATTPHPFYAVGQSYQDFTQTTDEQVRDLLHAAWRANPDKAAAPAKAELDTVGSRIQAAKRGELPLPGIGDEHFVLLGEASHGSHEFYAERARITRWLIEQKGFDAVAVEADWPDAYRVNRYVTGAGRDRGPEEALRGFRRFPTWMWRNKVVVDFVEWLSKHNARSGGTKAGFYGLDLYSLFSSMHEVISYLERVDPAAAARARERYGCFDHFGEDAQAYAYQAAYGAGETCEREVIDQLVELHGGLLEQVKRDGMAGDDELFYARQNARTVKAAEEYYRTMIEGQVASWNLRDRHMADTLEELAAHLTRRKGEPARIVVWAHNSHLGDARSTEPGMRGELNLGQLVRERHPGDCFLLGFTTYRGTVTAASSWGAPPERKQVRPALAGSFEKLFHDLGEKAFLIELRNPSPAREVLRATRLERAIGVLYLPDTERRSHYFRARLADQFDAVVHLDETRAIEPLERSDEWDSGELPETYPHAV
jgi:erythromycin esterase-like protein/predicted phosphoribosyltransferase